MSLNIDLKIWKRGSQKAPHKPLLLLYAIGRWINGQRVFSWLEVQERVSLLIEQFGGNAKPDARNPFVRLTKDLGGRLWQVEGELVLGPSGNPSVRALNKTNNKARFHPYFEAILLNEEKLYKIVNQLLVDHFSETQFEDILDACGLSTSKASFFKGDNKA